MRKMYLYVQFYITGTFSIMNLKQQILLQDEVKQVREIFANKLHKGLSRGIPNKCLPLDFMGFYALSGKEEEMRIKNSVRNAMIADINKRRDYVKTITMGAQGKLL